MTLGIDKMNGHGLSKIAHWEYLPRKLSNVVLATEGTPGEEAL